MSHPETDKNDLDWRAFLYACDEMAADDRESFELLLAENQAAREALARAVEIGQALAHANTIQLATPAALRKADSRIRSRRLEWMSIGAAASLALAVLVGVSLKPLWLVDADPDQGQVSVASLNSDLGRLAEIWGAQREQIAAIDDDEWRSDAEVWGDDESAPFSGDLADDSDLADSDLADSEAPAAQAPLWMLAALEGLSQSDEPEMDREIQEN